MFSRRQFTATGLSAAAMLAASSRTFGESKPESPSGSEGAFTKCAQACSDCQRECDACARHCATQISQGHKHHMATLESCLDCATVCAAASQIVSRQGPFSSLICAACADACQRCSKDCQDHGRDDKLMSRCADECRRCETACRDMMKDVKFQ